MEHFEYFFTTTDGIKLFAQGWEPTDKPRVVICLIHGLGEHSGRYEHFAQFLTESGYSCLACDLRGHGKSEGRRGYAPSLDAFSNDISLLLEQGRQRYPEVPLVLYGHSMGGMLVLSHTFRHNVDCSAVVASGPLLRPGFEPPAWKISMGKILRNLLPTMLMANEIDCSALSRDPEIVQAYKNDPLVHDRLSARLGIDMLEEGLWLLKNVREARQPLLLMHGSDDRICSPQATMEFARNAGSLCTLKIWEGFYHEIHNEPEKDLVFRYLLEWLEDRI
jgi:acylglycerol lipase